MQVRYWLVGLALVAQSVVAAQAEVYHYGDELDVARVIAMSVPQGCDVGEARMTYEDSEGVVHTVTYLRQGENCKY